MRLLLVEDDTKLSRVLAGGLGEEGYVVDQAANAEDGEAFLLVGDYDVAIFDWRLPGRSGLDLVRAVRARGKQTPILMLTARDEVESRVKGLDSGADDYLTKPFALDELFARLRALTRRANKDTTHRFQFADLVIDPALRQARRGQRRLDLTTREYQLLLYFVHNKGRVVTRSLIGEHLWGLTFEIASNVIDVHVRNLRSKLEEGGEARILFTVRGAGYRLDDPGVEASP